ncbi:MAG: hypothetical protein ACXWZY_09175 [Gaiellaceae bacterium]
MQRWLIAMLGPLRGYDPLAVLHHDRLVRKVDATVGRVASVLQVHAIHEDVRFTRSVTML